MQKISTFFHFIAPFLHIQHQTLNLNLIIRLNIIDHHLSSSTNETVTATQSAIPSTHAVATSTHAVATSTHAATTLPHAAMTTTQAPSGRYTSIYIDLFNVSDILKVPSTVCVYVHVHYTSIKFHSETSLEQLLSTRPCNFPSLKYSVWSDPFSQIRQFFLFSFYFNVFYHSHLKKDNPPLSDSLLLLLKNIKTNLSHLEQFIFK